MKRETLLYSFIALLLLLNVISLFFLLGRPEPDHLRNAFDEVVTERLHFTDEQKLQFGFLKRDHHSRILTIDDKMAVLYEDYFGMLAGQENQEVRQRLEKQISDLYQEKIRITYQHFDDLRAICTPEQKENFKHLVPVLMNVITPQKKLHPPRRN